MTLVLMNKTISVHLFLGGGSIDYAGVVHGKNDSYVNLSPVTVKCILQTLRMY
jgi:hypothetical protein